jgi:hypothetical protein
VPAEADRLVDMDGAAGTWAVPLTYVLSSGASTTVPTTVPTGVITVDGGAAGTTNVPGQRQDAADFYGIIVVVLAIVFAVVATRFLFGRKGERPE